MFEQALLDKQGRTRRPWTVCVSFLLQMLVVGAMVMVPLVFTDALPKAQLAGIVLAPSPPPPPPPPPPVNTTVSKPRVRVLRQYPGGLLMAPVNVPDKIAMIVDAPEPAGAGVSGGIEGGIPGGSLDGAVGSMLNLIAPALHVSPPPPVTEVKQQPKPIPRIPVGGNVQEAKIIHKVIPVYPLLARQARVQGTVQLTGIIGRDGAIQQLQVVSGHMMLVPAALEAVRQWRYQPTYLNGEPVEVVAPITVNFILNN